MNNKKGLVAMVLFLIFSGILFSLGHQPIELIAWEKLADFIVDIPGWDKKGDLEGIKVEVLPKSEIWQGYVSKDGKRNLEIHFFDSAKSIMILMLIKMMMNDSKTSAFDQPIIFAIVQVLCRRPHRR